MASTVMHPKAAAGPGRSERRNVDTLNPPPRDSAKAPPVPTFPASAGPIPRSAQKTSSEAGPGRSEHRNVDTL